MQERSHSPQGRGATRICMASKTSIVGRQRDQPLSHAPLRASPRNWARRKCWCLRLVRQQCQSCTTRPADRPGFPESRFAPCVMAVSTAKHVPAFPMILQGLFVGKPKGCGCLMCAGKRSIQRLGGKKMPGRQPTVQAKDRQAGDTRPTCPRYTNCQTREPDWPADPHFKPGPPPGCLAASPQVRIRSCHPARTPSLPSAHAPSAT